MQYIFGILEAHWITQCGFCWCYLKNYSKLPQPSVIGFCQILLNLSNCFKFCWILSNPVESVKYCWTLSNSLKDKIVRQFRTEKCISNLRIHLNIFEYFKTPSAYIASIHTYISNICINVMYWINGYFHNNLSD